MLYRIAGHTVSFSCPPLYQECCRAYETAECGAEAELKIDLYPSDIEDGYRAQYLNFSAVLRRLGEWLPMKDVILCHGAAISVRFGKQTEGYLFMAPSGTGKTTHIRLWKKYLGDIVEIVNGDKPFISREENGLWVHGSPWAGKEKMQSNTKAPLKGICFLQRGEKDWTENLEGAQALWLLLRQIYIPHNSRSAAQTLEIAEAILREVPIYRLHCDMSENAVICSYEALTDRGYGTDKSSKKRERDNGDEEK